MTIKQITVTMYVAPDGTEFRSYDDAAMHAVKSNPAAVIAGRTVEDLEAARRGDDELLREALEQFGRICGEDRRARGDRKRPPRGGVAAIAEADTVVVDGVVVKSRDGEVRPEFPSTEGEAA